MTLLNVNVKWGKNKYPVQVNTDEEPILFKAQLFALTNVEPDKQKVLIGGKPLKDDVAWSDVKIKGIYMHVTCKWI